ncbi:MAG: TspO/MBR family protein [Parcubacteria group bacterium]
MDSTAWYAQLKKPAWAPPDWLFGPVWSVLYLIIFVSFGAVLMQAFRGDLSWLIATPFILNILFNALFTPIQFGLKNNLLAAVDILLVVGTLAWGLVAIFPHLQWVAYVNLPYLTWGLFATALQLTITRLNPHTTN